MPSARRLAAAAFATLVAFVGCGAPEEAPAEDLEADPLGDETRGMVR